MASGIKNLGNELSFDSSLVNDTTPIDGFSPQNGHFVQLKCKSFDHLTKEKDIINIIKKLFLHGSQKIKDFDEKIKDYVPNVLIMPGQQMSLVEITKPKYEKLLWTNYNKLKKLKYKRNLVELVKFNKQKSKILDKEESQAQSGVHLIPTDIKEVIGKIQEKRTIDQEKSNKKVNIKPTESKNNNSGNEQKSESKSVSDMTIYGWSSTDSKDDIKIPKKVADKLNTESAKVGVDSKSFCLILGIKTDEGPMTIRDYNNKLNNASNFKFNLNLNRPLLESISAISPKIISPSFGLFPSLSARNGTQSQSSTNSPPPEPPCNQPKRIVAVKKDGSNEVETVMKPISSNTFNVPQFLNILSPSKSTGNVPPLMVPSTSFDFAPQLSNLTKNLSGIHPVKTPIAGLTPFYNNNFAQLPFSPQSSLYGDLGLNLINAKNNNLSSKFFPMNSKDSGKSVKNDDNKNNDKNNNININDNKTGNNSANLFNNAFLNLNNNYINNMSNANFTNDYQKTSQMLGNFSTCQSKLENEGINTSLNHNMNETMTMTTTINPNLNSLVSSNSTTPVVMITNLNEDQINCDRLFILCGVFGDVIRVKISYHKRDTAFVQLANHKQAKAVVASMNRIQLFGKMIHVNLSRMSKVKLPKDSPNSIRMFPDAKLLTKDYSNSKLHRYSRKNGGRYSLLAIGQPSHILHVANLPPNPSKLEEFLGAEKISEIEIIGKQRTCQAFVRCLSVDLACQILISKHAKIFYGQEIKISFATRSHMPSDLNRKHGLSRAQASSPTTHCTPRSNSNSNINNINSINNININNGNINSSNSVGNSRSNSRSNSNNNSLSNSKCNNSKDTMENRNTTEVNNNLNKNRSQSQKSLSKPSGQLQQKQTQKLRDIDEGQKLANDYSNNYAQNLYMDDYRNQYYNYQNFQNQYNQRYSFDGYADQNNYYQNNQYRNKYV